MLCSLWKCVNNNLIKINQLILSTSHSFCSLHAINGWSMSRINLHGLWSKFYVGQKPLSTGQKPLSCTFFPHFFKIYIMDGKGSVETPSNFYTSKLSIDFNLSNFLISKILQRCYVVSLKILRLHGFFFGSFKVVNSLGFAQIPFLSLKGWMEGWVGLPGFEPVTIWSQVERVPDQNGHV